MKRFQRMINKRSVVLAILLAMIGFGIQGSRMATASPAFVPTTVSNLPGNSCTLVGTTRTCDLWATTGTVSLPNGASAPIWGYADSAGAPATLPGPAIIANEGETLVINLTNTLPAATAISFLGQDVAPDLVGAAANGGTASYSFDVGQPGTYLYEAGLLQNSAYQTAMGMHGAIVVRPAAGANQAYNDALTAFDDEALVVLSELDPFLNNNPAPWTFDMRDFKPRYWLLNGKSHPDTVNIETAAGNKVLVRYVNASLVERSMSVLGLDQKQLGVDGQPHANTYDSVAVTLPPGQAMDNLVEIPATAPAGSLFALYDGSFIQQNGNAIGQAGMVTFFEIPNGTPIDPPPTTSGVTVTPNKTDGTVNVFLEATIASTTQNIAAAEYFIGAPGPDGTGNVMDEADTAFDSPTEVADITIFAPDVLALGHGNHNIYVHGRDAAGTWGSFNVVNLELDLIGPDTHGMALTSSAAGIHIQATGNDSATGNSNIVAAEYTLNAGAPVAMDINVTAPIASLTALIDQATIDGLAPGVHTVEVRAQDAFGHWGPAASADISVDNTGPTTTFVSISPTPNDGETPINPTQQSVRVDATVTDIVAGSPTSTIHAVEGFIDTVGPDGTGFPMTPVDGIYNEATEDAWALIPLSTVMQMTEGVHPIFVHAQDSAGNWGAPISVDFVIDKTAPALAGLTATPNPVKNDTTTVISATATDSTSVVAAEFFVDTDPGVGNATAMAITPNGGSFDLAGTLDVTGWTPGTYTIGVRALDAAGHWSTTESMLLTVNLGDLIFADSFQSGDFSSWFRSTRVTASPAAAMDGDGFGMAINASTGRNSFVRDRSPNAETRYIASFLFDPNDLDTASNRTTALLLGRSSSNQTVVWVQARRFDGVGSDYQVRMRIRHSGGIRNTAWVNVAATNQPYLYELDWEAGPAATVSLSIDGSVVLSETLNTSALNIGEVRLGASGGLRGATGTMYFDDFISNRN